MGKRILAVDDSKTMRDMVSFTLRKAGFHVDEAEDGKKALTVLSAGKFDLIITDLNMPNMDGISLIKNVRSGSTHRGVPILILTTESDDKKKSDGKARKPHSGWLVKPLQPGETCVSNWWQGRVCPDIGAGRLSARSISQDLFRGMRRAARGAAIQSRCSVERRRRRRDPACNLPFGSFGQGRRRSVRLFPSCLVFPCV